jgi:hypothetical protein
MPVSFEHVDEEEFNAAIAYFHSGSGPFIVVFSVEEVILKLLFGDLRESCCKNLPVAEPSAYSPAAAGGARTHTGQLQGSHGFLVIIFHAYPVASQKGF